MAQITKRTLTSEYVLGGKRLAAGTEIDLAPTALKRAVEAGVVHQDDALNAEAQERYAKQREGADPAAAPVNDAAGQRPEPKPPGKPESPAPQK